MKRLVTGATGFIGRHLVGHLKELYPRDAILALSSKETDLTQTVANFAPDQIYHLAGRAQVTDRLGVADYFPGNFLTTAYVLDAAGSLNKPVQIFFSSSIHVYGNHDGCVDETVAPAPQSAYGFTKYLAEELLRNQTQMNPNLRVAVARLSNCIGPGQAGGFVAADLCEKIIALPKDNSQALEVGPLSGVRAFLDVRDAVSLFPKLLGPLSNSNRFEIFNVASGHEISIGEVLQILLTISGKTPPLKTTVSNAPNQFAGFSVSVEKLSRMIPHPSFRPIRDSLKDMYETKGT